MKKTILVVDDEPDIVEGITLELREREFEVCKAHNGLEAVRIAKRDLPDLIILDVMMPGMDGTEVASILRDHETTANIPIIFLTGLKQGNESIPGFSLHTGAVMGKPFITEELVSKINEFI